ncbi:hypothetical protein FMM80_02535 [Schaedlerella arabinosiphila]|uniref:Uncharacterized protein n=1 Tax=Schaedlerella arabinosiphila TaxID=2044587 RepID=A0A9X5H614_9FIRM|nr:hypothetical protein [Schaedlerella arabinosiphila]KAI4439282.1 hypothetical protein C824_001769 [Schaedlerella arabinosiphila]NDO67661.1 hypothetical protein [Schaedlerella arabinosiphila]
MKQNEIACKEAFKTALFFTVCALAVCEILPVPGRFHIPLHMLLISLAVIFTAVYSVSFYAYRQAERGTSGAWFCIGYCSLAGLEEKLNAWGNEGWICEKARPGLSLFKLRLTEESHFYKAAYVKTFESTSFRKYILEHREKGWEYIHCSGHTGIAAIALFSASDPDGRRMEPGHGA